MYRTSHFILIIHLILIITPWDNYYPRHLRSLSLQMSRATKEPVLWFLPGYSGQNSDLLCKPWLLSAAIFLDVELWSCLRPPTWGWASDAQWSVVSRSSVPARVACFRGAGLLLTKAHPIHPPPLSAKISRVLQPECLPLLLLTPSRLRGPQCPWPGTSFNLGHPGNTTGDALRAPCPEVEE